MSRKCLLPLFPSVVTPSNLSLCSGFMATIPHLMWPVAKERYGLEIEVIYDDPKAIDLRFEISSQINRPEEIHEKKIKSTNYCNPLPLTTCNEIYVQSSSVDDTRPISKRQASVELETIFPDFSSLSETSHTVSSRNNHETTVRQNIKKLRLCQYDIDKEVTIQREGTIRCKKVAEMSMAQRLMDDWINSVF